MMHTLRNVDHTLGMMLHDGAKILFFMLALVVFIISRGYQDQAIPHPYSLDYGEAPLVNHAMSLTRAENIYRAEIAEPPYTITNYPPLYIALIALSVKMAGPASAFLVGRMISALCCWIAAFCILLILHALTHDLLAALTGAVTFLAFPFVVFWSPLLRIDMLALALSLCALTVLILKSDSRLHFIAAGLLLVAAIYTRQSYALAAPFAAFLWLLARDWKQAFRFAALVGGVSVLLFFILNILTNGGFFYNIVTANVNEFRMEQVEWNARRMLEVAMVPLLFGATLLLLALVSAVIKLVKRSSDGTSTSDPVNHPGSHAAFYWNPVWALSAAYLIGSIFSAATIGKVGSNVNYLLELCAGLGLAVGVVIAWSRAHLKIHALQTVILVILAIGLGRMMQFMLGDYGQDLRDRRAAVTELHQLKAFVEATPGEILADEYMGMLTLLGRPLTIQPFEVTQLAHDGKWDQTPLLERIENKEFAAIILYDRPWSLNDRWTPEMAEAISRSYRLVDIIAENQIYQAVQPAITTNIDSCPQAKWRLPTSAALGIQWDDNLMEFFGRGNEGSVPVHAVADGWLTRQPDWVDLVAILHDDPEDPTKKVWAFYGGMASASGDSFIVDDFPPGAKDIPVKAGQIIGYQGKWSGKPQWSKWMGISFAVEKDSGKNTLPTDYASHRVLNPTPFMGLSVDSTNKNLQPVKCEGP